jgi:hypothetical protein
MEETANSIHNWIRSGLTARYIMLYPSDQTQVGHVINRYLKIAGRFRKEDNRCVLPPNTGCFDREQPNNARPFSKLPILTYPPLLAWSLLN